MTTDERDADWELLSAFLDGELSADARTALEERLAAEQDLSERLAELTALETDLRAVGADLLSGATARAPARPAERPRSRAASPSGRPRTRRRVFAMAAALAVAAGLGALVADRAAVGPAGLEDAPLRLATGDAPTSGPIWRALETASTGAAIEFGAGRVAPLGTFYDSAGRACREVEVFAGTPVDEIAFGVACRGQDGGWRVEFAATAPAGAPLGDALTPAAGPGLDAFEQLLDSLGAGPMLGPDAEAALIARGWSASD